MAGPSSGCLKALESTINMKLLTSIIITALTAVTALAGVDPLYPSTDREAARVWFNKNWSQTQGADLDWTGNIATLTAGTTSQAWQQQTLNRVNCYRAMAGGPRRRVLQTAHS